SAGTVQPRPVGGFRVVGQHTYGEEGTYPVGVTIVAPGAGGANPARSASAQADAQVADAPLSAQGAVIVATAGQPFGGIRPTFTDANPGGSLSDYTARIHWSDGSPISDAQVRPRAGGGFEVIGSHTFAPGYAGAVGVMVRDKGGSKAPVGSAVFLIPPPILT